LSGFWLVVASMIYFLVCLGGLALLIMGLPGTWLIVAAAAVFAWVSGGSAIPWAAVVVFILLSAGAEVFEAFVGAWGARKYGGSRYAMVGAIIGGIAGAVLLAGFPPVIGSVIGAFGGSFAGAFLLEYAVNRDFRKARSTGRGAMYGRIIAVVTKAGLAVAMIVSSFVLIIT